MGTNGEELPAESDSAEGQARNHLIQSFLLFIFLLVAVLIPNAIAQQATDCLLCHAPSTGLKNSPGKSITVSPSTHMKGPPAAFGCVDCHAGASAPTHSAKTASAACVTCHADA